MRRPALPMLMSVLLAALTACSSGGGDPAQAPPAALTIAPSEPEVQPAEVVQFTANADAAVTWAVVEAGGGTIDADGHYTAPDAEGTFTVTAATASDRKSTAVHVKRNVSPPVISSFTATPASVAPGTPSTLAWTVTGATTLTIDVTGPVTGGTQVVEPTAATTYTLTATNSGGSVTAQVTVGVDAPRGTGASYGASFLTGVTGGGAMPDWSANVLTAACAGDGVTDDTACLQAAANAARDQRKPLVIPPTSAFYRIVGPFTVYGSVAGVGGTPTIKQTSTSATYPMQKIMVVAPGTTGWIYNLHLVGTFDGSNPTTEHGHQIDVGTVNGLTIKDNLLENAMGDAVGTDISAFDGGTVAQNVIVDGNTMRNPYRCAVAFVYNAQSWVITNNVIDKPVNFVSGIDIEPERAGVALHVEIAYNRFVMDNRTVNPTRGADGMAVFGWHVPDPPTPTAGGDYYLHHNYGTFGTGFSGFGNGGWGYVYEASNVEGPTVPR